MSNTDFGGDMFIKELTMEVQMRKCFLAFSLSTVLLPAGALTIHSTPFIVSPTNFNGFEALGPVTGANGVTSHIEDGISVQYVGGIVGGGIDSQLDWAPAVEGSFSWFPGDWGLGYTRITFGESTAIQLLATTSSSASQRINFQLFLGGNQVANGVSDPIASYLTNKWTAVGFSGLNFDEVRLSMPGSGVPDTAALDAIAISAVPELSALPLWLIGIATLVVRTTRSRRLRPE